MKVGLFNANGLAGKLDLIDEFINKNGLDLCCILETHFREAVTHRGMGRPFINLIKPDLRDITGGRRAIGGVAIYSKDGQPVAHRVIHTDPSANFIIISIQNMILGLGYFPPTPDSMDQTFQEYCTRMSLLCQDCPGIMLGDFNTRMGARVGDSTINTRGRSFGKWLDETVHAIREEPVAGCFTTYANGGRGVTDHVVTFNTSINQLVVHERESLGGSDHRPLTFSWGDEPLDTPEFTRWNVRAFTDVDVRDAYVESLEENYDYVLGAMNDADMSVNDKWEVIKNWITVAAEGSCGRGRYKRVVNADFMTPELLELRDKIWQRENDYVDNFSNMSVPGRRAYERVTTALRKEYRAEVKKRRKVMFRDAVDNLGETQNTAAFMRMVKGAKARHERTQCKLDPEKIDEYALHFKSTFGAPPTGEPPPAPPLVQPAFDDIIVNQAANQNHFSEETIVDQLKQFPLGKAAGIDGIMPEMFVYGRGAMVSVLHRFFNCIYAVAKIPDEWRESIIIPIFKKKGDDKDIKNYRPLAMTVVARRLYERCLKDDLVAARNALNDYQGGFRPNRATLDQVFVLDEISKEHPDLHHVFLDIKAAYDTVDRRRLWWKLRSKLGIPEQLVTRLIDLFDHNVSKLVLAGKTSIAIDNLRGLLQGCSLSPDLFSFFINDLLEILWETGDKTRTYRILLTICLFFADDGALHSTSYQGLKAMLRTCEEWARENGIKFAPQKCEYLGPKTQEELDLTIDGTLLPKTDHFEYLGMQMDRKGIDFASSFTKRTRKAKTTVNFMRSIGLNLFGWPLAGSIRIYKAFIRPQMEYGLALGLLTPTQLKPLEQAQNHALRAVFGCGPRSSIQAMQKVARVEPMKDRNAWLSVKFATKLHNSTDATIPAVRFWREAVQGGRKTSLATVTVKKNQYWPKAKKRPAVLPLNRDGPVPKVLQLKPFEEGDREKFKQKVLDALEKGVAEFIDARKLSSVQLLLQPRAMSQGQKATIIRWLVGTVAQHQDCKNCEDGELSRQHAIECTGVHLDLELQVPAGCPMNAIDYNIAKWNPERPRSYLNKIENAIVTILRDCRKIEVQESGYWQLEEDEPQAGWGRSTASQLSAPLRGNQSSNPRRTAQRAAIAAERNRPVGRPWRPREGVG